jgi:hypothetical protein
LDNDGVFEALAGIELYSTVHAVQRAHGLALEPSQAKP